MSDEAISVSVGDVCSGEIASGGKIALAMTRLFEANQLSAGEEACVSVGKGRSVGILENEYVDV